MGGYVILLFMRQFEFDQERFVRNEFFEKDIYLKSIKCKALDSFISWP